MNKVIALLLVACLVAGNGDCARTQPTDYATGESLMLVLPRLANSLHFRYTIEDYWDGRLPADKKQYLLLYPLPRGPYRSADGVASSIRRAIPDATVSVDLAGGYVIHIMQRSAAGLPGNILNEKLKSFSYRGELSRLPEAIGDQLSVSFAASNDLPGDSQPADGLDSHVSLNSVTANVRTVLTMGAAQVSNHYGCLWRSTAYVNAHGGVHTSIEFCSGYGQ